MAAMEGLDSNSSLTPASYIFVRVLGSGAFGEAVLYQKTEDNSLVVWKEVNLARLNERQQRDSQGEIDILSLLNHANIISYYNHFIDENTLFIEMEYANGGTLHEKISRSLELWLEKDVLWYLYQLASALAYIHDFGIIHRDIKTLNIFLTKVGLIKLGDFGISRFLESKSQMAETLELLLVSLYPLLCFLHPKPTGGICLQPYPLLTTDPPAPIPLLSLQLVGTPYYMSPEIMKGEKYNFKSDIWALGCVLYEMLTLEKIFQATNPLKLAMKIVKTDHSRVDNCYSDEMCSLVDQMLRKKPEDRPTAEDILVVPLVADQSLVMEQKVYELNSVTRRAKMSTPSMSNNVSIVTSKMREMYQWGGGKLTPKKLELFTREKSPMQVAVGPSHFAAITLEKELYTWANLQGGACMVGQLGHGDTASCKSPKLVDSLLGVPIQKVECGEDFTLCVSVWSVHHGDPNKNLMWSAIQHNGFIYGQDEGALYAFGSNYYGCLGCELEEDEVLSPVSVEFFMTHPVQEVACGDSHVIVLTRSGDVYTWGCGEFGRLGSGSEEDFRIPNKVGLPGKQQVQHVVAGGDSTFLVCVTGKLLACGSNQFNKLGFNSLTFGLRKRKSNTFDIPCKNTFSTVKPLSRYMVVQVSAGKTHSGVIDSFGHLYMFGCNKFGQLGVGDFKPRPGVCRVGGVLAGQRVEKLACGDEFTVVATNENHIYSWGNGDSGRLGGEFIDQGIGPNGMCTSLPRAIFGSLHVVSCLSCCHWHTLIIAEKVLTQKTLKSSSKSTSRESVDSILESGQQILEARNVSDVFCDGVLPGVAECDDSSQDYSPDVFFPPHSQPSSAQALAESRVPTWLMQELNEAEVIPIPTPKPEAEVIPIPAPKPEAGEEESLRSQKLNQHAAASHPLQEQVEPPHQGSTESAELKLAISSHDKETVSLLTERVAKLEEENIELKMIITEQARIIEDLKRQLP